MSNDLPPSRLEYRDVGGFLICETCIGSGMLAPLWKTPRWELTLDDLSNLLSEQLVTHLYCTQHVEEKITYINRYGTDLIISFVAHRFSLDM